MEWLNQIFDGRLLRLLSVRNDERSCNGLERAVPYRDNLQLRDDLHARNHNRLPCLCLFLLLVPHHTLG